MPLSQRNPTATFLVAFAILGATNLYANGLEDAVGQTVNVQLHNGRAFQEAELVRVDRDAETGEPTRLRVRLAGGKSKVVGLAAVASVTRAGEAIYSAPAGTDEERIRQAKPRRKTRAERRAEQEAAEHKKWLSALAANGVEPWPELNEKDHLDAIVEHRRRYEAARELIPHMQLVETEHFLFATNLTPREVGPHVAALDRMYAWMQQAYGVDPQAPVWRGKASVFAFREVEEFALFEQRFFRNTLQPGTAGLCHQDPRRNICIAAHRGASLDYFAVVLVHETSHGFIHCYQTPVRVPSWVNEGMAEVIASMMVPQNRGVQRKEKRFVESMRISPRPRLGEAFFATNANIPYNRYGGATSMTRFLLETSQPNYVRFINLLKTGTPWEEALSVSYNATKQQLVSSFGRRIGVPYLTP